MSEKDKVNDAPLTEPSQESVEDLESVADDAAVRGGLTARKAGGGQMDYP